MVSVYCLLDRSANLWDLSNDRNLYENFVRIILTKMELSLSFIVLRNSNSNLLNNCFLSLDSTGVCFLRDIYGYLIHLPVTEITYGYFVRLRGEVLQKILLVRDTVCGVTVGMESGLAW